MRAITITDNEERLQLVEKELPKPMTGQVLVQIKAAALNRRDQWIREGKYPGIVFGTTLGSDGAGTVIDVGDERHSHWLDQEVIINPNINWGENPAVQDKSYNILGMPKDGTFAEYVVVEADRLHAKPSHLNWEEAAALPLGGLTAFRAIFHHGHIAPGKSVLISGVGGGVAQFAFQFAVALGAEVYVSSGDDHKLQTCIDRGALGGFNYKSNAWHKEAAKVAGGFDLVIDSAGGDQMNDFIHVMRPAGRIVFYGATNGLPHELDLYRMFWNQITVQGSTMGNDQEFGSMLEFVEQHQIKPIIDSVFPLNQGVEAFDKLSSGVFGKVVLSN